jgi:hypothetical protein
MARRTRREIDIADHLWDCLTRIAEDCGTDRHAVVNQAVYELARRFNYLTPAPREAPVPEARVSPVATAGAPARPEPREPAPAVAPEPPRPAPVEKPRRSLYVVNSAGEMHKIDKETFIIGRSRTCDLVIPSSKVSRQHSGVSREDGVHYIEDLGSANGVWKDGVKIQKERISDGDEFMISEEVLKFVYR